MFWIWLPVVLGLVWGFLILRVYRQLAGVGSAAPASAWLAGFQVERFEPMQRLLDTEDLARLDPDLARRLRVERRAAFRSYLRLMRRDFARLACLLRARIASGPEDRSDLAARLVRAQMRFAWTVVGVEARLALHAIGFTEPKIGSLVDALAELRLSLDSEPRLQAA